MHDRANSTTKCCCAVGALGFCGGIWDVYRTSISTRKKSIFQGKTQSSNQSKHNSPEMKYRRREGGRKDGRGKEREGKGKGRGALNTSDGHTEVCGLG